MDKSEGTVAYQFSGGSWGRVPLCLPNEASCRIIINGEELVTLLCTPMKLDYLIVEYLYNDGYISAMWVKMGLSSALV